MSCIINQKYPTFTHINKFNYLRGIEEIRFDKLVIPTYWLTILDVAKQDKNLHIRL